MINYWIYKTKRITDISDIPDNVFGFVYRITITDNNNQVLKYIGKKQLYSKRKKKFTKKQLLNITDKRSKKYEHVITETDWKTYNSSCIPLKEIIINKQYKKIKKEIISFCYSSVELKYEEAKQILLNDCLVHDHYFNANVQIKIIGKLKFKNNVNQ